MSTVSRRSFGLDRYSGFYLWALFIVIFALWTPSLFLTKVTLRTVVDSQAVPALLAIAIVIPLAAGVFDLSVGATIGFSAVLVAWLQSVHHWNMWLAILVSVASCTAVGLFNGFVVVKLHVSSFIVTLGTATIVTALQTVVAGSTQPLPPSSNAWNELTQHQIGGIQIIVLYMLVAAVLFWWLTERMPFGRYLYATGGNPDAARLSGVNVGKLSWQTLVISATVSGIAGVLYCSQTGPSLTFGSSMLLPAFAAAFLGSTQIKPGRVNVVGTLLAVFTLATGVKGLQLVTGVQWLNDMFNGVALIGAVAFATWRQRAVRKPSVEPMGEDPPAAINEQGSGSGGSDRVGELVPHASGAPS